MSRVDNSFQNIKAALIGQVSLVIVQYIVRKILISNLPIEYVGYSGLFTNILLVLSLAELGLGTAIVYCLYEPMATKKYGVVNALLTRLRKIYIYIAIIIAVCGMCVVPFLKFFISGATVNTEVRVIFIMYLINTVVSYCFSYRTSLFIADQKFRTVTNIKYLFMVIVGVLQSLAILLAKNYYLYLFILILGTFVQNLVITYKASIQYRVIIKTKPTEEEKKSTAAILYKNVFAMAMHKFSGVVVLGTDNILISKFSGIGVVGLYSNYVMIKKWVDSLINTFFNGIVASIGNLSVTSSKEKIKETFDVLFYIAGWGFAFCAICLSELYNPFIKVWLGSDFIIGNSIMYIIILNFYISVMRQPILMLKNATGHFWDDRFVALAEAGVNIIVSIILGKFFGIFGVLLGTTISSLTTIFIAEPIIVYKKIFGVNPIKYYLRYFEYFTYMLFAGFVTHLSCGFNLDGWLDLGVKAIICVVVPNLVLFVFLFKKKQFKDVLLLIKRILKKERSIV